MVLPKSDARGEYTRFMAHHLPSFPSAGQAQISVFKVIFFAFHWLTENTVRANQKDLFHVLSFKEQVDTVLRSWLGGCSSFASFHYMYLILLLGTRWLLRWDKEVDLALKLLYYGLTIGRGSEQKPSSFPAR